MIQAAEESVLHQDVTGLVHCPRTRSVDFELMAQNRRHL
jgi:hypothetical protein